MVLTNHLLPEEHRGVRVQVKLHADEVPQNNAAFPSTPRKEVSQSRIHTGITTPQVVFQLETSL